MCSSNTLSSVKISMPDYVRYLEGAKMHDAFYSVLARNATDTKIESLDIDDIKLSQRQSASRDLAQFICKMPHLRELHLGGAYRNISPSLHDEFYSTLSSLASSAKHTTCLPTCFRTCHAPLCTSIIEYLDIRYIDLSQRLSALSDLAQLISSSAKIEILHLSENLSERPSASRDFAQFICKMNHLKNLTLYGQYHDDFYSTASSMASTSKIEILHLSENLSERPSASRDLAQFICKMNHLKNLTLYGQYHDDFYSTASSMASTSKIETLNVFGHLSERSSASRDLAQFICKMNHLKNLKLCSQYHDDFYSTASSMASASKIEILHLRENLSERPSASRDFAQFICKMNHLKNLTLYYGRYHDDFYSTASSMASTTKIEILHHNENLRKRPSASRDLAQFICKMNHLKNLKLCGQYHGDFYSTALSMASTIKDDCNTSSNVTDLTVTDYTLEEWQDCGSMFDNVKRFTIQVWDTITCDVIQRIHLPAATELTIQTRERVNQLASLHDDPTSLPNALHKVSSQLVKVTFRDLNIGNSEVRDIIQAFRSSDEKLLKILRYDIFSLFNTPFGHDERLSVDI
ncbi:uncharacterized protein LOC121413075 [Lytechinus variegatus]|uniref:uncharacterized protein LOC121413075 n=1 Tax=Lytechinus variegatus TaxID=7654 RepID=UPI001BB16AAA|nr:uncharacterized protein LOC121413075 [Lytechinus variegatus]